ncbi:MAG: hypothetical protein CMM93_05755 [Rickettsiales bacterium]|nr:hypothetical protein [Rickettsiales bacterium]|tara:strand:- start:159 stop:869 length:711 start_codon:yes stop_codon:yes gene_type:complete
MTIEEELYQRILLELPPKADNRIRNYFEEEYRLSVSTNGEQPFISVTEWEYIKPLLCSTDAETHTTLKRLFELKYHANLAEYKSSADVHDTILHIIRSLPSTLEIAKQYKMLQPKEVRKDLASLTALNQRMSQKCANIDSSLTIHLQSAIRNIGRELDRLVTYRGEVLNTRSFLRSHIPISRTGSNESSDEYIIARYLHIQFIELFGEPLHKEIEILVNALYDTEYTYNGISGIVN